MSKDLSLSNLGCQATNSNSIDNIESATIHCQAAIKSSAAYSDQADKTMDRTPTGLG